MLSVSGIACSGHLTEVGSHWVASGTRLLPSARRFGAHPCCGMSEYTPLSNMPLSRWIPFIHASTDGCLGHFDLLVVTVSMCVRAWTCLSAVFNSLGYIPKRGIAGAGSRVVLWKLLEEPPNHCPQQPSHAAFPQSCARLPFLQPAQDLLSVSLSQPSAD